MPGWANLIWRFFSFFSDSEASIEVWSPVSTAALFRIMYRSIRDTAVAYIKEVMLLAVLRL
jgi:hypothetical protein